MLAILFVLWIYIIIFSKSAGVPYSAKFSRIMYIS